jgi:hypothetical protein
MDHGFRIVPRSETAALQPYLSFRNRSAALAGDAEITPPDTGNPFDLREGQAAHDETGLALPGLA